MPLLGSPFYLISSGLGSSARPAIKAPVAAGSQHQRSSSRPLSARPRDLPLFCLFIHSVIPFLSLVSHSTRFSTLAFSGEDEVSWSGSLGGQFRGRFACRRQLGSWCRLLQSRIFVSPCSGMVDFWRFSLFLARKPLRSRVAFWSRARL